MTGKITLVTIIAFASIALAGCATTPMGAVVPMAGGTHQSVVKAGDKAAASRAMDHDAKLTCGTPGTVPMMNKDGKYIVVSQTEKAKDGKAIEAENKNITAGIAVGLRYIGLESKDTFELTTVFKCQPTE